MNSWLPFDWTGDMDRDDSPLEQEPIRYPKDEKAWWESGDKVASIATTFIILSVVIACGIALIAGSIWLVMWLF